MEASGSTLNNWQKVRYYKVFYSLAYQNSFRDENDNEGPYIQDTVDADKDNKKSAKCQKCGYVIYHIATSHLGLVVLLLLYSMLGALMFQAIEGNLLKTINSAESENKLNEKLDATELINNLIVKINNSDYSGGNDIGIIQGMVINELKEVIGNLSSKCVEEIDVINHWDFSESLYFCFTVYTTIGFGVYTPATIAGKIITIIYAIFGIPLCLITLADIGMCLRRGLRFIHNQTCYLLFKKTSCFSRRTKKKTNNVKMTEVPKNGGDRMIETYVEEDEYVTRKQSALFHRITSHIEETDTVSHCRLLMMCLLVTFIYISLGSLVCSYLENWSYTDSFYFVFISLSTIGFGDFYPKNHKFFVTYFLLTIVGLSLVAMTISSMTSLTNSTLAKAKKKVDNLAGRKFGIPEVSTKDESKPVMQSSL